MGFRTVAIGRGRDKEKLAKDWGHTSTSIAPPRMPPRYFSVWAGRERFLLQEPAVMPWEYLCLVLQPAAS